MSMEREQYQPIAIGVFLLAAVAAIATGRLPRWMRISLVFSLLVVAFASALLVYRITTQPTSLTLTVGSIDSDAANVMSAFAIRMAAAGSSIRLKVVDKGSIVEATKAFSAGQADLAIVRADIGDLSAARTVLVATHAAILIIAPPGSTVETMQDLKGKTVGVINEEINQRVVSTISEAYDLDQAKVQFKDLTLKDVPQALKAKQVHALLVVMPISAKYLGMLRDLFPNNSKLKLRVIAIDAAGAIAETVPQYESFELPKGTIRGSPPVPEDDLSILRVPLYLIANRKLSNDVVAELIKTLIEIRRELMGEFPLLATLSAPSTDKDALIPIHPGAAAYLDGSQKSFFDKYGDHIFYGTIILGLLAPLFIAIWKYLAEDHVGQPQRPLTQIYALKDDIDRVHCETELAEIERHMDDLLAPEFEKLVSGQIESDEMAALSLATHRLEYLMARRRAVLNGRPMSTH
jgi:TRAP transporter TAXI family solute receptor